MYPRHAWRVFWAFLVAAFSHGREALFRGPPGPLAPIAFSTAVIMAPRARGLIAPVPAAIDEFHGLVQEFETWGDRARVR